MNFEKSWSTTGAPVLVLHLVALRGILRILVRKGRSGVMSGLSRNNPTHKTAGTLQRSAMQWDYPTGMVWCPMKMSGIAVMRCVALQKELGCGSLSQFSSVAKGESVPFFWPWLKRRRRCPERADEREVRELRLLLSPLRPVEKIRKNPRALRCPACGGQKTFGSRQCRRCWRQSMRK
jgi:hypothetical protein